MAPMTPGRVVGTRVREHRDLHRLTQSELAERLGEDLEWPLDRTVIARIESGERQVTVDELFKLAAALNTTPVLLMTPRDESDLMLPLPWRPVTSSRVRAWISDAVPMWEQDREAYQASTAAAWERTTEYQRVLTRLFDQIAVLYGVESLDQVAPDAELEGLAKAAEEVVSLGIELAMKRQDWITHVGDWEWDDPESRLELFERHPRFTSEAAHVLYGRSPVEEVEARILDSKPAAITTAADASLRVRSRVEHVLAVIEELGYAVEERLASTATQPKYKRPQARKVDENPA